MRVLWITPNFLPAVSKKIGMNNTGSGGWLGAMAPQLQHATPPIDLCVLTLYNGSHNIFFEEGGITYLLLPDEGSVFKDKRSILKNLRYAIASLKPDLIDIQGVEFHYAKYVPAAAPGTPIAATLQGLVSEIHKHYFGNIPLAHLIRFRTLKDNLLLDGMIERQMKYRNRGISELEAMKKINYFIGRTYWDRSVSFAANPRSKYYHSQRNIREEFHNRQWSRASAEAFTVFVSQAHAPFKGFHIVLEAVAILKKRVPNLRIRVAGRDMLSKNSLDQRLRFGGYQKYIYNLIKKNNLFEMVSFIGPQSADEMADNMSRSHVFVLSSFIENSPNSLGEAQLMGVPSIATFVGGVPEMIKHNENGFLYNAADSAVLANLINEIFFNDNLSERISSAARRTALCRYNSSISGNKLASIYRSIYSDFHNMQ